MASESPLEIALFELPLCGDLIEQIIQLIFGRPQKITFPIILILEDLDVLRLVVDKTVDLSINTPECTSVQLQEGDEL